VDADPLGLDPGQRLVSDMHTMFEAILGNPHHRPSSPDDPYRWDRLSSSQDNALRPGGPPVQIEHGPPIMTVPNDFPGVIRHAETREVVGTVSMRFELLRLGVALPGTPYEVYAAPHDPLNVVRVRMAPKADPHRIDYDVRAGHCMDMRARYGGKVRISHGVNSPWRWCHQLCPKYVPEGEPADFAGGAPDWLTAWAYARRHVRNFHGVELGAAGWPTDGSA